MKPIHFSGHAKGQAAFRGTTEKEVENVIKTSEWSPAELNKLECRKDFVYKKEWNKKFYKTKQVRPIFAEEEKEIVVITVYVYYF
jgi:hypothetical protein